MSTPVAQFKAEMAAEILVALIRTGSHHTTESLIEDATLSVTLANHIYSTIHLQIYGVQE